MQVGGTNYNRGRSKELPASNGLLPTGRQVVKEITKDLRCLSSLITRGRRLKLGGIAVAEIGRVLFIASGVTDTVRACRH
jgi:hypothetical protein